MITPVSFIQMGCCFSTPKPETPKLDPDHQNGPKILQSPDPKSNATHEIDHRALPPPLPVEEETVKEVLSETPISKPQVSILMEERNTHMAVIEHRVEKFEAKPEGVVEKAEAVSEVSQVSEICSVSESFSTTTTIAERREDEVTNKRLNRPPSSNPPRKRPYTVDSTGGRERRPKSPARRPGPSPEKKKKIQGSARSVHGRESGQVGTRKLNVGPTGVRRDPGEAFGRRSRSPSTRSLSTAGGGRQLKPPAKGLENSGSDKVEEKEKNDDVAVDAQESLDNPHVSLECFIFL